VLTAASRSGQRNIRHGSTYTDALLAAPTRRAAEVGPSRACCSHCGTPIFPATGPTGGHWSNGLPTGTIRAVIDRDSGQPTSPSAARDCSVTGVGSGDAVSIIAGGDLT